MESGEAGATTNRIADRAGVSVGSLYQYFPNKDSLFRALIERHLAEAVALRPALLDGGAEVPLADRLRAAVHWHLAAHARDPALHRVLGEIAPRVLGTRALRAFERLHHESVRRALEPYAEALRPRDPDLVAFVVSQCLEALTHGAVVHRPERIDREELADEMTRLLVGYLTDSPPGSAPASAG